MNKIYKIIWSKARNCYVVVSEIAKRNGKCSSSMNKKLIAAFLAAGTVMSVTGSAWAAEDPLTDAELISVRNLLKYVAVKSTDAGATASGKNAVAIGAGSSATAENSIAIGNGAVAKGKASVVIGADSVVNSGDNALIFGAGNTLTNAKNSIIVGAGNTLATGTLSNDLIFGSGNTVNYGVGNIVIGDGQTLKGTGNSSQAKNNIVLGSWDAITGEDGKDITHTTNLQDTVMIGHNADAKANYAVAIGSGAKANTANAVSMGYKSDATGTSAVAIGNGAKANGSYAESVGYNADATGTGAIAIGYGAKTDKNYTVALGYNSSATGAANGTALGYNASVTAADGVALGSGSIASAVKPTTSGYDLSTGKASTLTTPVWRATKGAVSVGSAATTERRWRDTAANGWTLDEETGKYYRDYEIKAETRQITNVAAGSEDTDAVNVAQLKTAKPHYLAVKSTLKDEGSNYENDGATGTNSIAIGPAAAAKSTSSVAVGNGSKVLASADNSIVVGASNTIEKAKNSVAIGSNNSITNGLQNIVLGDGHTLSGTNTSSSAAKYNVILGAWDKKGEDGAVAPHTEKVQESVMIGHNADAKANYAVAIGSAAEAQANNGVSVGYKAISAGTSAVALGNNTNSTGTGAIAIGYGAKTDKNYTIALGYNSSATEAANGTALGYNASVTVADGVALGSASKASTAKPSVSGYDMSAGKASTLTTPVWRATKGAVSVGSAATTERRWRDTAASGWTLDEETGKYYRDYEIKAETRQITNVAAGSEDTDAVNVAQLKSAKTHYFAVNSSIKTEGSNYEGDGATGSNAIAIGAKAGASKTSSIAIGYESVAEGVYGAALGYKSNVANKNGIALGNESSVAGDYGVALGSNSAVTEANGMALGYKSSVSMADGVALGSNSAATVDKGVEGYDISGRTHTYDRTGTWISTLGALSVGDAANNKTRQITNVAAGSADTDAVNVAQLKKVTDVINSGVDSVKTHYYSIDATNTDEGSNYNNDGAEKYKDESGILRTSQGIAIGVSAKTQRQNAIAIGTNARVLFSDQDTYTGASWTQANGIALGTNATVLKAGGVAIGSGASTGSETPNQWGNYGSSAVAIGEKAKALGSGSVALGTGSVTEGDSAYTHGGSARAIGNGATAWGLNTLAGNPDYEYGTSGADVDQGSLTTAWGSAAQATGNAATAWGGIHQTSDDEGNTVKTVTIASGRMATAFGQGTHASGWGATTWGDVTEATEQFATAFGSMTKATGSHSTSFGSETEASGYSAAAWGMKSIASGTNATAFGLYTEAKGYGATAFGVGDEEEKVIANGIGSAAFGYKTVAASGYATAFGQESKAFGTNSLAIMGGTTGKGSVSIDSETGEAEVTVDENAQGALAAGEGAQALKSYTYAIGKDALAEEKDTVAIGNGSEATAEGAIVFGNGSSVTGKNSIAIGTGLVVSGEKSGAFGDPDGDSEISGDNSYAFGNENSITSDNSFILGNNAEVAYEGGVALGADSKVLSGDAPTAGGFNPATGEATYTDNTNVWTATTGPISVGSSDVTRQIKYVAAGSADTDAVNVAQLKAARVEIKAGDNITVVTSFADDGHAIYTLSSSPETVVAQGTNVVVDGPEASTSGGNGTTGGGTSDGTGAGSGTTTGGTTDQGTYTTNTYTVNAKDTTYEISDDGGISDGKGNTTYTITLTGTVTGTDDPDPDPTTVTVKDTNTTYTVVSEEGTKGNVINTYTLTDSAQNPVDVPIVDTDTQYKLSGEKGKTAADGSTTYTISLKDQDDNDAGEFKVVDTNTQYKLSGKKTENDNGATYKISLEDLEGNDAGSTTITDTRNTVEAGENITVDETKNDDGSSKYTINAPANGKVASGETGIVSGDTVYNETRVKKDGNYIKKDNTAAENITALDEKVKDHDTRINNINNQFGDMDNRMRKGLAGAAALAALHPMDFNPDDKLQFSAGVGNYRGETAAALGMFYRPDESVMFSIGGTFGNSDNMVNAGITFGLDGTRNRITRSRTAMAHEIVELKGHIAKQDAQIAKLTALVNKLVGPEQALDNPSMFPDVPENHWAYEYVADLQRRGALKGYPDGLFKGDRAMTRYEFAAMLDRALQNGVKLDEAIAKEFEPELGRIYVERINGQDNDRNKIERVRVNNSDSKYPEGKTRDVYGGKIVTAVPEKAASK